MKLLCIVDYNCAYLEKGKFYDCTKEPTNRYKEGYGYRINGGKSSYIYGIYHFAKAFLNSNIKIL
jgi:hypothetical protein